jgi:hypothetical protein
MGDTAHFWITLVILAGGSWVAVAHPEFKDSVFGTIALVVGYWFGARKNGASVGGGNPGST